MRARKVTASAEVNGMKYESFSTAHDTIPHPHRWYGSVSLSAALTPESHTTNENTVMEAHDEPTNNNVTSQKVCGYAWIGTNSVPTVGPNQRTQQTCPVCDPFGVSMCWRRCRHRRFTPLVPNAEHLTHDTRRCRVRFCR